MTISDWQDGNPPKSGWYPVLDKDGHPSGVLLERPGVV
jgi:hypothetical protein